MTVVLKLSRSEKCPELQTWEKSKNLDFDELSRLGTERVNGVRRKFFFVLKRVFFDQATSKNNFWKNFFSVRGRLTRSLPSNFPKIIDFHWKFSKLWKAITPSILVVGESFRPFWNPQTKIFQKSDGLFRAISIRKMSRAENVRKVRKPRFWTRYLVLALNVLTRSGEKFFCA